MSPQILPIIFFILLAFFFLQKAIRPNARRSLGWGRSGGKVPVSRLGYAVWGSTFIAIAVTLIKSDDPPSILMIILVGCVLGIVGVGMRDSYLHRKRSIPKRKDS